MSTQVLDRSKLSSAAWHEYLAMKAVDAAAMHPRTDDPVGMFMLDYVYDATSDFMVAVKAAMAEKGMTQEDLADYALSAGKVATVFEAPEAHLTFPIAIRIAYKVGLRVKLVATTERNPGESA